MRGPVARHTNLRQPGIAGRLLKGLGLAVSAVLVSVLCVAGYVWIDYTGTLNENSVTLAGQDTEPPAVDVLPNEPVNILVTGIDKCERELMDSFIGRCSEADVEMQENSFAGQLNDVTMVVHISPEPRRVTVIQIPRDMMTARPACTDIDGNATYPATVAQFNEAYSIGGVPCVALTAEELTGLPITHAAMMTWGGVIDITNAIGGVDVCVAERIYDPEHTGLDLPAGEHTLVGEQALQFLRVRTGVGGSDLARIGNQQVYMGSLVRKLVSDETLGDVGSMLRLSNAVVDNATLSSGLTNPMAMVSIANAIAGVSPEDYTFLQFPAIDYAPDPNRVAPDEYTWELIRTALENNQPIDLSGEGETPAPTDPAQPVDPTQPTEPADPAEAHTPSPAPTEQVALPDSVRGSNADEARCSNQETLF